MTPWRSSTQTKLIVSMGTALLLSVLTVIALYALAMNRQTEGNLVGQMLPERVKAIRNDLERTLAGPVVAIGSIANNPLAQNWLADGEAPQRIDEFVDYLEAVRRDQQALTTSIVSLESGRYYSDKGLTRTVNRSNPQEGWFYSLVDSAENLRFEIDIDKATGKITLFINQRISRGGETLGVAGLGFSLDSMSQRIADARFGQRGEIYLVRPSDQKVKIHPDSSFNDTKLLAELVGQEASARLLANPSGAIRFERAGETFLSVAQPLDTLGWVLIAEIPEDEIFAEARQVMWTTSAVGLAIALGFLIFVALLARGLVRPIRTVTTALTEIGSGGGDLTRRLDDNRDDELGDLARGFNRFVESQHHLISQVRETSQTLRSAVAQVALVVENTAERADRQQQMTDMVATAVNEMGLTVQEVARNASDAAGASRSARGEASEASQQVSESTALIERMSGEIGGAAQAVMRLADEVASIDQVLAVIRGISDQTNLLALNAAIEAARAGEAGRGFAVVADEVRTLASKTRASTEDIQNMIGRLKAGADTAVASMQTGQAATETGVESSQRTGSSLTRITGQIERISNMNMQVATATEEQSSVTEEINRNIQGIATLAADTATDATACRSDCRSLQALADDLSKQMSNFRL